ncbi:PIN-like domain-containing protein [Streptomyces sp. ESR1.13]|uniref:PIN-like domain-containing protein n=1 Tax=unclassified Streptomyces TaxID=2593676 RepID=UPI0040438FB7
MSTHAENVRQRESEPARLTSDEAGQCASHRERRAILPEEHQGAARIANPSTPRGIFDCDDAYRTPTREDYKRLFASGLVVLDTNVLLNLYRSNERTRNDTFSVLSKLRDRLWIPHQVLSEFWRNRDLPSVRGHHRTKAKETCAALDKAHRSMSDALDRWLRDVHLFNDTSAQNALQRGKESMASVLVDLQTFIQTQAERDALKGDSATQSDPVLSELDRLLHGRIGEPFSEAALTTAVKEAEKRADKRIPPGYEDFKNKPAEQAAGDYLVWAQLLDEAERRQGDVLLVTGDVKADWWIPGTSHVPARPRTELIIELRNRAAAQLYMITPSRLLMQAKEIYNLRVDERSVSDLATAEREQSRVWSYGQAIEMMLRDQFPQAEVLTLDEQIEKGVTPPIPDIAMTQGNCKAGIEVKKYLNPLEAEDIEYLGRIIERQKLQAVLVVSHSPLSPGAISYLHRLASESGAKVAWLRLRADQVQDIAGCEALKLSVESLIGA